MSNNAMSNETDLDWLARNVHVWPTNTPKAILPGDATFKLGAVFYGDCVAFSGEIGPEYRRVNKADWLARRAELQEKPSWAHAPEWAVYMAQSPNGHWEFFAVKPRAEGWWRHPIGERSSANNTSIRGAILGEWFDTLEKRPEDFKPFASIEDNQELSMTQQQVKQDNGWFERGELPPVGIECEAKKYGKEEYYKVVICGAGKHLGLAVSFYEKQKGSGAFTCSSAEYFRPIRTERDVLIEIIKNTDDTDDKIADAILAAGFSLRGK